MKLRAFFLVLMLTAAAHRVSAEGDPIRIGAVLPLTGEGAFWGEHGRNGIQLAGEEINASGGVFGRKLELLIEDGRCNGAAASTAIQKLINVDRVSLIVGEVCSSATLAMAPIAERSKTLLLNWEHGLCQYRDGKVQPLFG